MADDQTTEIAPTPRTLIVPSEEHLYDLLNALNVSGETCELPCVMVVDVGSAGRPNIAVAPFLATLTDPDADYVNYITSDESGHSRCVVGCENCGSEGYRDDWRPTYPVTALVGVWPDLERCRQDDITTWWEPANHTGLHGNPS